MWAVGFKEHLKNELVIFDGAMGTMLQSKGLKAGDLPELLNITQPELIVEIHEDYLAAGAKVLTTNTFGANALKLKDTEQSVETIIQAAVKNAKKARGDKSAYIALDIGPLGELLEPMGTLTFEEAYDLFKEQVLAGVKNGVDLVLIETMTDLYEAKAAVLAVKENSNLPVLCTMSFEENKRTFTGCSIPSMVMVLQGLGVDALGVNCSLGPKELEAIVDEVLSYAKVPVLVQANAGLPTIVEDETVFNFAPERYAAYGRKFVEKGVKLVGGCCGTTAEHIQALVKSIKNINAEVRETPKFSAVCTPTNVVMIDGVKVIGERINPTGKKRFKEALVKDDIDYILKEAITQVDAGAEILDVNVGLPEINEAETMVKVIKEIQSILHVPLQIDSTDPKVIEQGLRIYNGKALVNSVNGEEGSLESILPLVKKYGAAVLGLTLDEKGIPETAEGRFAIAEKIVKRAEEYGIAREDIYIDCLTLTAAAQQEGVKETLKALQIVKERLGVKTVLGVSNVSFGLPNRGLVNKTFLAASLYASLDLPIIDPLNKEMMDTVRTSRVLWNEDKGAEAYLASFDGQKPESKAQDIDTTEEKDLYKIILQGMKDDAKDATKQLLNKHEALQVVNEYIVPALDVMGERYERGDIFLPQLIRSAETVKESFEVIKEALTAQGNEEISNGKIVLATVQGDVHDIGKNIVKVLLENYNYEVIDLGKNVPKELIVEEAKKHKVKLVGLSALMTTTVKHMEETIQALKTENPDYKVMVGGAVLNEDYAKMIKADYYGQDAREAVNIAREVLG